MRFYTKEECQEWLEDRKRKLPDVTPGLHRETIFYPREQYRYFFLAHYFALNHMYREPALLWITEWGIWGCENWHLYYKLRHTYGDHRLLHEAPGHLFLPHEAEDLATFLQVAMLNGWGGYVLMHLNYVNVFFSHDEYLDIHSETESLLADIRKDLASYAKSK